MNRGKHIKEGVCTVGFPAVHVSVKGSYYLNPLAVELVKNWLGKTPTNVSPDYDRKTRTIVLTFNSASNYVYGNSKLTEAPDMNRIAWQFAGGHVHDHVVARLDNVFDNDGMFYGRLEVDRNKEFGDDPETRFIVRLDASAQPFIQSQQANDRPNEEEIQDGHRTNEQADYARYLAGPTDPRD